MVGQRLKDSNIQYLYYYILEVKDGRGRRKNKIFASSKDFKGIDKDKFRIFKNNIRNFIVRIHIQIDYIVSI